MTLGGMCKGSGMIHPNMCTMLGFLTTDAVISKELLAKAFGRTCRYLQHVSVDGDTSTNDTLLILANGMAENPRFWKEPEYAVFQEAFTMSTRPLQDDGGDGEGATALFEVKVIGAAAKQEARTLARSVVSSSLCKSAVYGHDANWGRFLCALGYSGVNFDRKIWNCILRVRPESFWFIRTGRAPPTARRRLRKSCRSRRLRVIADMKAGTHSATAWGCDLTYDYVKINADYRS